MIFLITFLFSLVLGVKVPSISWIWYQEPEIVKKLKQAEALPVDRIRYSHTNDAAMDERCKIIEEALKMISALTAESLNRMDDKARTFIKQRLARSSWADICARDNPRVNNKDLLQAARNLFPEMRF
jgi:hypothetical protein